MPPEISTGGGSARRCPRRRRASRRRRDERGRPSPRPGRRSLRGDASRCAVVTVPVAERRRGAGASHPERRGWSRRRPGVDPSAVGPGLAQRHDDDSVFGARRACAPRALGFLAAPLRRFSASGGTPRASRQVRATRACTARGARDWSSRWPSGAPPGAASPEVDRPDRAEMISAKMIASRLRSDRRPGRYLLVAEAVSDAAHREQDSGSFGSASIFSRRWRMCTSMVRGSR